MSDTCATCDCVIVFDCVVGIYECGNMHSPFYGQEVSGDFCCPWRKAKEDVCASLSSSFAS